MRPFRITICLAVLWSCRLSEQGVAWRHEQELLIGAAVLQDLAEKPAATSGDARTVFCVGVGEKLGTSAQDPDPALMEALRRKRVSVLPASGCEMKGTLVRKGTSEDAVLLGVGRPEWKADSFVRVVGWRFVSPVAAGQWAYTLSLSKGQWTIDTSKLLSIS